MVGSEGDNLPAGDLPPEVCIASRDPNNRWGDRYVLVEQIGEGGLGTVWKAWDRHLEKFVAIKRIRGEFDAAESAAFLAEGRVVARLHHPNIATVFDIGILEGAPYIVMQLVEGETLSQTGDWNAHRLALVLKDVTRALDFSHRHGVLHQDLKPENLMIVKPPGEQERVVVLDFAISRLLGGSKRLAGRIGTPGFMSPEQEAGSELDARSDIYGLGVTFRSLLPARRLPREVKGVIDRCVALQPANRFGSMEEMGGALDRVAAHPARRKRAAILLSGAVLLLIASAIYVLAPVIRERQQESERAAAREQAQRLRDAGRLEEAYAEVLKADDAARELRKEILLALNGYETVWEQKLHTEAVTGVGFLADGSRVVSAGRDMMLQFWDAATGERLLEIPAHEKRITALDVSPDKTLVATTGEDLRLKLWSGKSGDLIQEWTEESSVTCLRFSPDGLVVATGALDGSVRHRTIKGGGTRIFTGPRTSIRSLAFSSEGTHFAAGGSEDSVIHVWSLGSGGQPTVLRNNVSWARCLAFTGDCSRLIVGFSANFLRAFDIRSGRHTSEWMGHGNFVSEVFLRPAEAIAVTSSGDKTVRFWDVASGKTLAVLPEHPDEVLGMAVYGNRILTGCLDGTVRLSDRRWEFGEVAGFPRDGVFADLGIDHMNRLHATRVVDGELRVETAGGGERVGSLPEAQPIARVYPGPGTSMAIVICRSDGAVNPPANVVEVAIRRNGEWIIESVSRDHVGWWARGAWAPDGAFHVVHGGHVAGQMVMKHSTRTPTGTWSHIDLGSVPQIGSEFSVHCGPAGPEMLLVLMNPNQVVRIPPDAGLEALSSVQGDTPLVMKTWKDRTGRTHGVGIPNDYNQVLVFSETSTGGEWRRFKSEGEKVAAVTGWFAENGAMEIRWVVKDSNRIRSARLPSK